MFSRTGNAWISLIFLVLSSFGQVPKDGERLLEEGRSTLDETTLGTARKAFAECVLKNGKDARCYYNLGRADSYLSSAKELQKNKKAAERALDSAIEETKLSLEIDDRQAATHALLADLYGRKIGAGGMMAGMRYGPKAEAEAKRALELDPNNALAYTVNGRRELYAPKMFGGDLDKAIESFRKATAVDPKYDDGFVWLAIAYRKKGDSAKSQAALAEALRLNGKSAFAKRIQSGAPD